MVTFIGACGDNFTLLLRKSQIAHSLHIVFFFFFFFLFCFVFFATKTGQFPRETLWALIYFPRIFGKH